MELAIQPVQSGLHIIGFAASVVMFSLAQSHPAEVEAEYRKTKAVQRFHRMEHDLVVHGAAEHRMRMANQGGMGRVLRAGIEQGFEPACRAVEKQRTD